VSKRYPMTNDQHAQIDCRRVDCVYNSGGGNCTNVSPAITLGADGKATCWSSYTLEEEDVSDKMTFVTDVRVVKLPELGTQKVVIVPFDEAYANRSYEVKLALVPELKACPICAGEARVVYLPETPGGIYIECQTCGIRTMTFKSATADVIAHVWNLRAKEAP
jgi:hypothetical protein